MSDLDQTRAARLSMALFFLQPMTIGAWFALIPTVKAALDLSKAELAVALLGMPVAVLLALQVSGRAVAWLGVRGLMAWTLPLQCAAAVLPLLAGGQGALFLALAVFGAVTAFLEVGMNVYAGRVEKATGALIMNRCHGFWALGLTAGSLLAALGAGLLTPVLLMVLVGLLSGGVGYLVVSGLPRIREEAERARLPARKLWHLPRALVAIGVFMLLVTLVEAGMTDWSAVYLAERLGLDAADEVARAGVAVTIFSGFMAAGRFAGDALKRRLGPLALARGSAIVTILGLGCLILPLPIEAAYLGFALVGLGVAAGYPLGVSAVAALDDRYEAANIAVMSTFALTGFLLGPPLVGFLGEAFGMRAAFAAMVPGLILCLVLAAWLEPGRTPGDSIGDRHRPAR